MCKMRGHLCGFKLRSSLPLLNEIKIKKEETLAYDYNNSTTMPQKMTTIIQLQSFLFFLFYENSGFCTYLVQINTALLTFLPEKNITSCNSAFSNGYFLLATS